jgi:hypothetical protein
MTKDEFLTGGSALLFLFVLAPQFFAWLGEGPALPGWLVTAALVFCGVALWRVRS